MFGGTPFGGAPFGGSFAFVESSGPAIVIPIPASIVPASIPKPLSASVKWDWYIATPQFDSGFNFLGFQNIGLLHTATNRVINLALNSTESASFTVNVLDSIAEQIWLHTLINCLVCYRDDEIKWSGPLWTTKPTINVSQHTLDVTCVGWFQYLLARLLKCGDTTTDPMVGPTSTSDGTQQSYVAMVPTAIVVDMFERTSYEYPLPISLGAVQPNPNGILWNVTYQQLQNIGQAIQQLSNVEGGFDFRVDPALLELNLYYALVKTGTTIYGRGQDRPNAIFTLPGNITELMPTEDASVVTNQMTVLDQLGNAGQFPAPGSTTQSILNYNMFQTTTTLSDIVSVTITVAYAEAEVLFLQAPEVIWTFTPLAYHGDEDVPQPLLDYDIGDFVYLTVHYGCIQIPGPGQVDPQPVRMFAYTVSLNDESVETVSNVQTVYQTSN